MWVLTASCVELGGGETETGECSPEFDSSCSSPFNFRFSSKATRARQKLFSCSFIVERRGKRFPQYWHAKILPLRSLSRECYIFNHLKWNIPKGFSPV